MQYGIRVGLRFLYAGFKWAAHNVPISCTGAAESALTGSAILAGVELVGVEGIVRATPSVGTGATRKGLDWDETEQHLLRNHRGHKIRKRTKQTTHIHSMENNGPKVSEKQVYVVEDGSYPTS